MANNYCIYLFCNAELGSLVTVSASYFEDARRDDDDVT